MANVQSLINLTGSLIAIGLVTSVFGKLLDSGKKGDNIFGF